MANDPPKAKRILHVKVKTPSADATTLLTTMMKNALPLYKAFGEAKVHCCATPTIKPNSSK